MSRWREVGAEVDAWRFGSIEPIPDWVREAAELGRLAVVFAPKVAMLVMTDNGEISAPPGWWLVRYQAGALVPVAPDDFRATFELANDPGAKPLARDLVGCPDGDGGYG